MSAQIKPRSFHLSPFFLLTLQTYPVQLYLFNLFNELSPNVSCTFECTTPILLPSSSFSPIINCLRGPTISPVFEHFRKALKHIAFGRGTNQNSSTSMGGNPQRELASASFCLCAAWSSLGQTAEQQIHSCAADELTDNCITPPVD